MSNFRECGKFSSTIIWALYKISEYGSTYMGQPDFCTGLLELCRLSIKVVLLSENVSSFAVMSKRGDVQTVSQTRMKTAL